MRKMLFSLIFILLALAACDGNSQPTTTAHSHSFGPWSVAREATCQDSGLRERACACGEVQTEVIAALGHAFTSYVSDGNATCTADSTATAHCDRPGCEATDTVTEPGTAGHICNEDGACTLCGYQPEQDLARLEAYAGSYGYELLASLTEGQAMQALYDRMDQAAVEFHTSGTDLAEGDVVASLPYKELGLTKKQAFAVWLIYKNDHPLYYWISTSVSVEGGCLQLLTDRAYASGSVRLAYNAMIDEAVDAYVADIDRSSAYSIALALHDQILDAIDYAYDENGKAESALWAHTILGVFEKGSGVCESYARTFQLLLNYCGVENIFVLGTSAGQDHAWNMAKMDDGGWYWFDLTYDDKYRTKTGVADGYFCVNDTQIIDRGDDTANDFLQNHSPATEVFGVSISWPDRSETVCTGP